MVRGAATPGATTPLWLGHQFHKETTLSEMAAFAHDKRNQAIADMRAILNRAADEKRDLTPEEQEQMDRADADVQLWQERTAQALKTEQYAKDAAEFRGIENRIETAVVPEQKLTEPDHFVRGWQAVKAGGFYAFEPDGREYVKRAMQTAGGSAIDESFSTQLTVYLREESPMFGAPITILNTPRGENFTWPRLTADQAMGGTITAEAGGIVEARPDPVERDLLQPSSTASRPCGPRNSMRTTSSGSRASSLAVPLGNWRSTPAPTSRSAPAPCSPTASYGATAGHTATGTASGQAGDTFFSPTDLLNLFSSVVSGYRNRSSSAWMVSTTAGAKMRIFKDSTGNFLWEPSLVSGQPDRFYGRPVIENPAIVAVASRHQVGPVWRHVRVLHPHRGWSARGIQPGLQVQH